MVNKIVNKKSQAGFSLIELLVVVAIIGVLAAAGIVGYTSYLNGVKDDTQKNIAKTIAQALETEITVKAGGLAGGICSNSGTNTAGVSSNATCVDVIITNGKFKDSYKPNLALGTITSTPCAAQKLVVTATTVQACKDTAVLGDLITVNAPSGFTW